MRRALLLAVAVAVIALGAVLAVPGVGARLLGVSKSAASGGPGGNGNSITTLQQAAPKVATLLAAPVSVNSQGFVSWAFLDRRTGQLTTSPNVTATNSTESMIKVWITSDYLRREAEAGKTPPQSRLDELTRMIRDSDDQAAEDIYRLDGTNAVVNRMIDMCDLTDTVIGRPYWWSYTDVSARDAVRLGLCVANGTAAGPKWTDWVLNEMRHVRGDGLFGIKPVLPQDLADQVAIKNGWTIVDGNWHLNCLAVHDDWILAVLNRYPSRLGMKYGADLCGAVTNQLLVKP
jgi:hypothetical protein